MSRDFTKNVSNFVDLPSGDAAVLNGSSITAFSLWAQGDTVNNATPDNFLFNCTNPGSASVAFSASISHNGGLRSLHVRGRATDTDSTRSSTHSTGHTLGQWVHLAGQIDWPNDLIYTAMNGVVESHATSGWTATAFSAGISGGGSFRIGANGTVTTADQWDGRIAHLAFWTNALLTTAEFQALAAGVSPLKVRRDSLVLYRPLDGIDADETDLVSHGQWTVTGSIPAGASEAPVEMFSDAFMDADPSWLEPSLTTIAPQAYGNLMRQMMAG
jgi:hypothetical protein